MLVVFQTFDVDNSGYIDYCELKRLFGLLGQIHSDEEIQAMMDEADEDGDGKINFEGTHSFGTINIKNLVNIFRVIMLL